MANRRVIKITKVDLNEVAPADLLDRLQNLYGQLDVQRRESLKAFRAAQVAAATHLGAQAQEQMLMAQFFALAAEADDQIAVESGCMPPYMDINGHLIVQIPFTERERRVVIAKQHEQIMNHAATADEDSDDSGLFSDNEDNYTPPE